MVVLICSQHTVPLGGSHASKGAFEDVVRQDSAGYTLGGRKQGQSQAGVEKRQRQPQLEEAEDPRASYRLGAAGDGEFAKNVADMPLGRANRNHQPFGNMLIRSALCQQLQHLQFALGKRVYQQRSSGSRQCRWCGRRLACCGWCGLRDFEELCGIAWDQFSRVGLAQ